MSIRPTATTGPVLAIWPLLGARDRLNSLAQRLAPLHRRRNDTDPTYAARGEIDIKSAPISRRRCIKS
jgi:hypothetical protein